MNIQLRKSLTITTIVLITTKIESKILKIIINNKNKLNLKKKIIKNIRKYNNNNNNLINIIIKRKELVIHIIIKII